MSAPRWPVWLLVVLALAAEIDALSGPSCGLHRNGGLMLAATPGELDSLKLICSRARYLGMETEMITLAEARAETARHKDAHDSRHQPCPNAASIRNFSRAISGSSQLCLEQRSR